MGFGLPGNSTRAASGSLLATWFAPQHPDSFVCGVRVVAGQLTDEGGRWRYRRSAVDPLVVDGLVTLKHGRRAVLRLRLADDELPAARPGFVTHAALEEVSGAQLLVTFPLGRLEVPTR